MLHNFFEEGDWFAAKTAGYGAAWPIAWQGWVLLLSYVALVCGIGYVVELRDTIDVVTVVLAIVIVSMPFLWMVKKRTRGGWKWRGPGGEA